MSPLGILFRSSLGRKLIMALTGLVMVGFVVGHLVGNLQIFSSPDQINGYAAFLHQLGPTLWMFRIVLIVSVALHVWAATSLTLENKRARGPEGYAVKTWLQASLSSRAVRWTGYIVLAFLVYHLAHFTLGVAGSENFKDNLPGYVLQDDYRVGGILAVKAGTTVPDVHSMVILGFQSAAVSIFYIIAVGLLSFHLLHGVDSLFQTLGWRSTRWAGVLRLVVRGFCLAYFIGNLLIPAAVLSGAKGLRHGFVRDPARQTPAQR